MALKAYFTWRSTDYQGGKSHQHTCTPSSAFTVTRYKCISPHDTQYIHSFSPSFLTIVLWSEKCPWYCNFWCYPLNTEHHTVRYNCCTVTFYYFYCLNFYLEFSCYFWIIFDGVFLCIKNQNESLVISILMRANTDPFLAWLTCHQLRPDLGSQD